MSLAALLPRAVFLVTALAAAAAPLARTPSALVGPAAQSFPGWPESYEGRPLTPLPLSSREEAFGRDFPGLIARFSDGRREIIVRYVTQATRRLHPAADCLKGVGYTITPLPVRREPSGALMSCQRAERAGQFLNVCEGIRNGRGDHWPDASAWYWSALISGATGPWWSFVVSESG